MKRGLIPVLVLVAMFIMASVALARPAPNKKAFTSNVAVTEQVAPAANLVPVTAGYDVILNISQDSNSLRATAVSDSDTSASRRLSPTVDWRSNYAMSTSQTSRSAPTFTVKRYLVHAGNNNDHVQDL